ncbi:MAG: hypothetical protein PUK59_03030 [Actinomycetaceae bacterium]|nr:hypothetical protein [Actinomycetaceae bacterium]MDY5854768.1 hypothetical protein [Arcanobacterium sp.]
MSTPTDPYNHQPSEHSDDEAMLAPLTSAPDSEAAEVPAVSYGDSDALAWESAFAAEEKSANPEPDNSQDALSELTFDEIPAPVHEDSDSVAEASAAQKAAEEALSGASGEPSLPGTPATSGVSLSDDASSRNAAAATPFGDANASDDSTGARTGRHLSGYQPEPVQPLEAGATFASAYSATGVTELPEPPARDVETDTPTPASTPVADPSEPPVRESVLPVGAADEMTATAAASSQWSKDPGAPRLSDVPEQPKSRVGAHIGSIFATLVLIPVCWYLISDAGVRLNLVENNPWATGSVNIGALVEMAGGFVALFLLWLMARVSTLGAQIWGVVLTLAGLTAIVVPSLGAQASAFVHDALWGVNSFTQNVAHHLDLDLGSGRIAVFGFLLFLTGLMMHLARKSAARRAEALTLREHILGEN